MGEDAADDLAHDEVGGDEDDDFVLQDELGEDEEAGVEVDGFGEEEELGGEQEEGDIVVSD